MLKTTVLTRGKSNLPLLLFLLILPLTQVAAQDWIRTGTNRGAPIRLAAPDFKGANTDPQTSPLNSAFNETLWNDLENAGLFEMVARSYYPLLIPGNPSEMKLPAWANPPASIAATARTTAPRFILPPLVAPALNPGLTRSRSL